MVISVAPYSAQIKTVFKNILIFHILGSSNDQMAGAGIKEESNCIFSGLCHVEQELVEQDGR